MSLFLTMGAATAQIVEGKQYRLMTEAGTDGAIYLNVGNTDEHQSGTNGGVNVVAFAEDDNQIFTAEAAEDGQYYLKSASGYYVKCWAWNVDGLAEEKTALTFEEAAEGKYYIKHAGGYFKVEPVGGVYYPFCDAGLDKAAQWSLVEVAVAEPEPEPVMVNVYHITAKDTNRGALYAGAENTHLTHCGATYGNYHNKDIAVSQEDVAQQFIFVEYEGTLYMYSLGAQKFAVKDAQYIKLTAAPEGFVTVIDSDVEGYKLILFEGKNRLNFSGGYEHGCVANYETPDDGNRLMITEVGSVDATEILASMATYFDAEAAALAAARASFDAIYAQAGAILEEANLSVVETELALQTTADTDAYYVWCNNPESTEGPIGNLVDGVVSKESFFHTNWHGGGEEPHYIEVDLGEGNELAEFSFKYTTRFEVQNDYPDAIQVLGSNDKDVYNEIYNVASGLPQNGATQWVSGIVSSEEAYRYLRFVVKAERTYWHMTEFDIITNEVSIADKYAAVANAVVALKNAYEAAADNAEYTIEQLNAAVAAIKAALAEINKDENTVALIAAAKELLAIEGLGYPAAAAREALQAAIAVAEEMPDANAATALQAAINAYYAAKEIVLPEAGKAYTFTAVWGNKQYYIYNNNGTLAVAARGEEELPESAKFVCEYDAEASYKFQFKTADGAYYLAYPTIGGKGWLDGESATGLEAESTQVTKFNVTKILAGGNVSATNEELFGLIQMDGWRGYDNGKYADSYGPIVVKHSAQAFDGASAPYYNENFTSAFRIEETELKVVLEVVSVSPEAGEVKALNEVVVSFNLPVTLDETKSIKLVSKPEGEEEDGRNAYIGSWTVFSQWPGYGGYYATGTIEAYDYQGEPALLCKGFTGEAGYDDSFIMLYNEDGSVTLPAQNLAPYESDGVSYDATLYLGMSTQSMVTAGSLIGNIVDGNIVFENSPENQKVADSWIFCYSTGDGLSVLSYFNDLVWTPATPADAPAKVLANVQPVLVESAIKPIAGAVMKANVVEYNVTAQVNAEDDTQLVITINDKLENGIYTLTIEKGAVVTADGQESEAIKLVYSVSATGIEVIESESNAVIYDLNGRKVNNAAKGIYIINGKKVLIK